MSDEWFLIEGQERRGPLPLEALRQTLLRLPDPGRALVWRDGLTEWREAASLPELRPAQRPPTAVRAPVASEVALVSAPAAVAAPEPDTAPVLFSPPVETTGSATSAEPAVSVDELEKTAMLYRRLVLLVGAHILLGILLAVIPGIFPPVIVLILRGGAWLVALALFVITSMTVYQLASRIGAALPVGWAIASWLPLVNLLVLFALSQKAQAWCTRLGIPVGLLGPPKGGLDWMRDGR